MSKPPGMGQYIDDRHFLFKLSSDDNRGMSIILNYGFEGRVVDVSKKI